MATATKQFLSASTDGMPITISSTSSASPVTIHTCPSGATTIDEIYLFTVNNGTTDATLTFNFGGIDIIVSVAAGVGLITQIPGLLLRNGKTVTAYSSIANVVSVVGFVNRIVN